MRHSTWLGTLCGKLYTVSHNTWRNETGAVRGVKPGCYGSAKAHFISFLALFKKRVSGTLRECLKSTNIVNLEVGKNGKDKIR